MMKFADQTHESAEGSARIRCDFVFKMMDFVSQMMTFFKIKNDELCNENDEFCRKAYYCRLEVFCNKR